MKNNIYNDNSK